MRDYVLLPPGSLIGIAGLCWAIAYAKFPTGEKELKNIDCIRCKRTLSHDPANESFSFCTPLTSSDRNELDGLWASGKLPQLCYPMTPDDIAKFMGAFRKRPSSKKWEPVFLDAEEINERKAKQIALAGAHTDAVLRGFESGEIIFVDANNIPLKNLFGNPLMSREQAVAYLNRCGLAWRDEDEQPIKSESEASRGKGGDFKQSGTSRGAVRRKLALGQEAELVAYFLDLKRRKVPRHAQQTAKKFGISDSYARRLVREHMARPASPFPTAK